MSKIKLKNINDVQVKAIKPKEVDTRPIKGRDVCTSCYSNIFCLAPTNGGKTTTMFRMIKECCGKKTKIVAFVSTIYNDDNWQVIKDWAKRKRIDFTAHTSIYEGKTDLLKQYVDELTKEAEEREKAKEKEIDAVESCMFFDTESEDEEDEKYQYPKYIFIFDDLSDEIRSLSYETLLKKSRHFRILTLTGSQDLKDSRPATRNQIRIWLLFKNLPPDRLQSVYDTIACNIPFELFEKMYRYSTKEKYNFFYVSHRTCDYRKNFNTQFIFNQEEEK